MSEYSKEELRAAAEEARRAYRRKWQSENRDRVNEYQR